MKYITLILAGWLFVSSACTKSETPAPPPSTEEAKMLNISYGADARNKMDVYLPKNRTAATPFVILIHGGAWIAGNKEDMHGFQDLLLTRGFASMSMSYRFVNATVHYEQLMEDVHKAVTYCASKSGEWNIRSTRIIISGASAGAHMALLYGYKYDADNRISGIISLAGPTDVSDPAMLNYAASIGLGGVINALAGATYVPGQPVDPKFAAASPLKQAKNIPSLLIHGTVDMTVPYSQAELLKNHLSQLGYTHKLVTIAGAGHDLGLAVPANLVLVESEFRTWVETYSR
ncbi:alpha/beta hydrolase [Chitinophaga niabensis]|uniref:Acetyl esterase/lipase n=1 Tax=Chitinophaga niabensis TaxID=536979 RepID=A0A1N6K4A7_9BACT|nr:alpha/beta hydrolase [Chitinophaga niabensis]SIO51167.1 Acetyl esterase/lipase [Chitinophaga niabensis]